MSSGLWLLSNGLIGASPDGIVDEQLLVEVKCPASAIKTPIAEMVKKGPGQFFLCKWKDRVPIELSELSAAKRRKLEAASSVAEDPDRDDELVLDLRNASGYKYWHQIQGQLAITNRALCDLLVWTPKEMFVIRVERYEQWAQMYLPKLADFYTNHFLPAFLKGVE